MTASPVTFTPPNGGAYTSTPLLRSDEQHASDVWALVPYVVRNFANTPGPSSERVELASVVNSPTPGSTETIPPAVVVHSPRPRSPEVLQQESTTSIELSLSEIEYRNNRRQERRERREARRQVYDDHSDDRPVRLESHSDTSVTLSSITHPSWANQFKQLPLEIITRLHSIFKGKRFVIDPPFSAYVVNRGSQFKIVKSHRAISANVLSRLKNTFQNNEEDVEPQIAAFIIRQGEAFQIPYSGRLKLPRSHLKHLDAQSSRETWFKTFGRQLESRYDQRYNLHI